MYKLWETVHEKKVILRFFQCPGCGVKAMIDEDQYRGKVSLLCPECGFHETIDLSKVGVVQNS